MNSKIICIIIPIQFFKKIKFNGFSKNKVDDVYKTYEKRIKY